MQNYADLMFTPAVAAEQAREGTRDTYARAYPGRTQAGFGADDIAFLESRDSIFIATVNATGWPYIQHRGGPQGFLKVLDGETLGFADYRGNRQFISKGNLQGDDRVSVFAIDYPQRARLKLQGHATLIEAADDPDLAARLAVDGQGRVERLMTIRVVAMDWNCPQFIPQRFTAAEMAQLVAPELDKLQARIAELEAENARLRAT